MPLLQHMYDTLCLQILVHIILACNPYHRMPLMRKYCQTNGYKIHSENSMPWGNSLGLLKHISVRCIMAVLFKYQNGFGKNK